MPPGGDIDAAERDPVELEGGGERIRRDVERHDHPPSVRASILELLSDLVRDSGLAMLYITHDLLSARAIADEVAVLHRGVIVEHGPTLSVVDDPQDAYTRELLAAIPNPFAEKPPSET